MSFSELRDLPFGIKTAGVLALVLGATQLIKTFNPPNPKIEKQVTIDNHLYKAIMRETNGGYEVILDDPKSPPPRDYGFFINTNFNVHLSNVGIEQIRLSMYDDIEQLVKENFRN